MLSFTVSTYLIVYTNYLFYKTFIFNECTQVLITRFYWMYSTLINYLLLKFSAVLTFQLQYISLPRIDKNIYFFRLAHFPNIINNLNVLFLNIKRMWFISNIIMHIYPAKKKETNLVTNLEKQDTVVSKEYLYYSSVCNTTKRKFYGVFKSWWHFTAFWEFVYTSFSNDKPNKRYSWCTMLTFKH